MTASDTSDQVQFYRHSSNPVNAGVYPGQPTSTAYVSGWHRVCVRSTFAVGQALLRFLEGVLSQEGLGGLQHRVDEGPTRLHLLHERLCRDGKEIGFTAGLRRRRLALQMCTFLNKHDRKGLMAAR